MKLKDKTTGKVRTFDFVVISDDYRRDGELTKFSNPFHILVCRSIEQLNEEWEDYKPAEPLIKDDKKRTSVKDFFGLLYVDEVVFQYINNCFYHTDNDGITYSIDFEDDEGLKKLVDFKVYSITELCGDSEEDEDEA